MTTMSYSYRPGWLRVGGADVGADVGASELWTAGAGGLAAGPWPAGAGLGGAAAGLGGAAGAAGAAAALGWPPAFFLTSSGFSPAVATSASTPPTGALSPSLTRMAARVPPSKFSISITALSV